MFYWSAWACRAPMFHHMELQSSSFFEPFATEATPVVPRARAGHGLATTLRVGDPGVCPLGPVSVVVDKETFATALNPLLPALWQRAQVVLVIAVREGERPDVPWILPGCFLVNVVHEENTMQVHQTTIGSTFGSKVHRPSWRERGPRIHPGCLLVYVVDLHRPPWREHLQSGIYWSRFGTGEARRRKVED